MRANNVSTTDMIEHHSVKNLIVGAILTGGPNRNKPYKKVEVFNPNNQRVCEMPEMSGDEQILLLLSFIRIKSNLITTKTIQISLAIH